MSKWKTKLFGDNRLNFYCSMIVGAGIPVASLFFVIKAVDAGASRSPTCLSLMAIWCLMLGQFGLSLQNYLSRLAEKLDKKSELEKENLDRLVK